MSDAPQPMAIANAERQARKTEYARKAFEDFRREAALVPYEGPPELADQALDAEALFLLLQSAIAFPLNERLDRGEAPNSEFVLNLIFQAGQGLGALMASQEPALLRAMLRAIEEGVCQGAAAHAEAWKPRGTA